GGVASTPYPNGLRHPRAAVVRAGAHRLRGEAVGRRQSALLLHGPGHEPDLHRARTPGPRWPGARPDRAGRQPHRAELPADGTWRYARLVARWGRRYYESEIAAVDELLAEIIDPSACPARSSTGGVEKPA